MLSLRALALLSLFVVQASSFGGFDPALIQHSVSTATQYLNLDALIHHQPHLAAPSASSTPFHALTGAAKNALEAYKHSLQTNPLPTKMMTGATLAMTGDAIAQSKDKDEPYDVKRAASFGTFDMAYRALQHISFPVIVEHCRGQFFTAAISAAMVSGSYAPTPDMTNNFAALEQTLASQLGIVPFLYYPVFFALTGFMQGLTAEGSVERAKQMFVPLMQRNLLFWIPVQFIQFGFIEEPSQIPFLSVCGLGWTFILSIMAGSTKTYQTTPDTSDSEVVVAMATADVTTAVFQAEKLLEDRLGGAIGEASSRPEEFVMDLPTEESYASSATSATGRQQKDNLVYEKQ